MTHQNHFTVLRLLAAWLVIVSHSYELLGARDPLERLTGVDTLGGVGVVMFFAMSGFLVTQSLHRDPNVVAFLWRRALRIFPAVWMLTILSIIVLGPLFTRFSLSEYFASPTTFAYLRLVMLRDLPIVLPGVFESNPYPPGVNGSLWTLPVEVACYLMLAAMAVLGLRRLRWSLTLASVVVIVAAVVHQTSGVFRMPFFAVNSYAFAKLVGAFLFGALVAHGRADGLLRPSAATLALFAAFAAAVLLKDTGFPWWMLCALVIAWCCLSFGIRAAPAQSLRAPTNDISYGLYLYAFPVQQGLIAAFPTISVSTLIGAATIITAALAALSWRFVEKPFLAHKRIPTVRGLFQSASTRALSVVFAGLLVSALTIGGMRAFNSVVLKKTLQDDPIAVVGDIDSTSAPLRSGKNVQVEGWAWHPSGVRRARAFLGDVPLARAELLITREAAWRNAPDRAGIRHSGFRMKLDAAQIERAPKNATLRIEFELHNGRTSTLHFPKQQ
jgi:peptidoglycan/LPS O-acetylase OafA/YrhL